MHGNGKIRDLYIYIYIYIYIHIFFSFLKNYCIFLPWVLYLGVWLLKKKKIIPGVC